MKLVIHLLVWLCCIAWSTVAQALAPANITKLLDPVSHPSELPTVTPPSAIAERLLVVMGEDTFPYQYVDNDGVPSGLLVDLWKEWGRQSRTELVFVPQHWTDSLVKLGEGKAQVHLGMAQTPERQQHFDFALPIAEVGTYLYLHQSLQGKKSIPDLLPYQIGIVAGSSHESDLLRIEPKLVFKRYLSREALLKAVSAGEIVVFAGLEGYLKDPASFLDISVSFPTAARIQIKTTQFYPAVQQGNRVLIDKINQGFKALSADFIQQTERRWLGYHRQKTGLVIAMHLGFDPYVNVGVDGLPHGLYVDMWQRWSQKTGIDVDFISGDSRNTVEDVRQRRADAHIGYPENEALKTGLTRAWPLYTVKSRLFLYKQHIASLEQLADKRIGVVPSAPYLPALRQALPEASLRYYDSIDGMVAGAKAGDISGFVASGAWTTHYLLVNNSWTDFSQYGELEFSTPIYVLTRTDDPGLTERIANGFSSISQQEFAAIEHKWMLNPKDHVFTGEK
ncbi:MAG: transporter substrate-binding domain-containing protein, partial [Shewanella sp.]